MFLLSGLQPPCAGQESCQASPHTPSGFPECRGVCNGILNAGADPRRNYKAFQGVFHNRIRDQIKDEMVARDDPTGLNSLIFLATQLNNHLRKHCREKLGCFSVNHFASLAHFLSRFLPQWTLHFVPFYQCPESPPIPSCLAPPVRSPCSWFRPVSHPLYIPKGLGLCLYCRQAGYLLPHCTGGDLPVAVGTLVSLTLTPLSPSLTCSSQPCSASTRSLCPF